MDRLLLLKVLLKDKGAGDGRAKRALCLELRGGRRGDAGGSGSPSDGGGLCFPASVCDRHRGVWPWQRERQKVPLNGCFILPGAGNSIPSARRGWERLCAEGFLRGCVPRGRRRGGVWGGDARGGCPELGLSPAPGWGGEEGAPGQGPHPSGRGQRWQQRHPDPTARLEPNRTSLTVCRVPKPTIAAL